MEIKKEVKNWLDSAQYDLETADMFTFLSKLSDISIPTRYPEDFKELVRDYDKETAKTYLSKSKEAFQWIRDCIKL